MTKTTQNERDGVLRLIIKLVDRMKEDYSPEIGKSNSWVDLVFWNRTMRGRLVSQIMYIFAISPTEFGQFFFLDFVIYLPENERCKSF